MKWSLPKTAWFLGFSGIDTTREEITRTNREIFVLMGGKGREDERRIETSGGLEPLADPIRDRTDGS